MPKKVKSISKGLLLLALLTLSSNAYAALVHVNWTPPTTNTDGSQLTDLSHYIIEWGTCVTNNLGVVTGFGQRRGERRVEAPSSRSPLTVVGLQRVCVRMFAVNTRGVSSDASNTAFKNLLPAPGRPVTLGQPVVIPN